MKKIIFLLCMLLSSAFMQAQVIHVPGDYLTIQEGISAADPGDTVLVSDGTYYEQINFLGKKPLMVASEFLLDGDTSHISNTIIDGSQISRTDTASVVLFISGEDTTSILCGLTITGGRGTVTSYEPQQGLEGGGIFLSGSAASIRNNKITGNTLDDGDLPESAGAFGAGVSNYINSPDWIILEYNEIYGNTITTGHQEAAGGGLCIIGNSRIRNNTIRDNTAVNTSGSGDFYAMAAGAACYSFAFPFDTVIFTGNKILNNILIGADDVTMAIFGAGAYFLGVNLNCSTNEFTGNKITTPTKWGGGGMFCESLEIGSRIAGNTFLRNESYKSGGGLYIGWTTNYQLIENNYFFDNHASTGGGMTTYASNLILQNNAFYKNYAVAAGGGVYLLEDSPSGYSKICILNSSFSGNKASLTSGGGGAIFTNNVNPVIINCILWNDSAYSAPEIKGNCPFIEIAYSDIDTNLVSNVFDLIFGEGIINEDPAFLDTLMNISELSPAYEAGIGQYTSLGHTWEAPGYDIEGIYRPQRGAFDMGAHEVFFVGVPESPVGSRESLVFSYPNPTGGIVDFRLSIVDYQRVSLKIYDLHGREVAVVLDEQLPAGEHTVQFDASALPAGVYFWKFAAGSSQFAGGKMIKF